MRKIAFLFVLLPLGLALVFLNEFLGSRVDWYFHPAELLLARSSAYYREGRFEAYENTLKEAILNEGGPAKVRSVAFYNLGNISLDKALQGDPVAAKDALFYFKEALRNDPALFPGKYNLELLLKMGRKDGEQEGQSRSSSSGQSPRPDEGEREKFRKGLTTQPPLLGGYP